MKECFSYFCWWITNHYMPESLLVFWLDDGLAHVPQVSDIDAFLVQRMFKRCSVHWCFSALQATLYLQAQLTWDHFIYSKACLWYTWPLTKAGIWSVMMKAAASLSNLSCRFIDAFSLGGKAIPETQEGWALMPSWSVSLNNWMLFLSKYLVKKHLGWSASQRWCH